MNLHSDESPDDGNDGEPRAERHPPSSAAHSQALRTDILQARPLECEPNEHSGYRDIPRDRSFPNSAQSDLLPPPYITGEAQQSDADCKTEQVREGANETRDGRGEISPR